MKINLGKLFHGGGGEAKEGLPVVEPVQKPQPNAQERVPQLDRVEQAAEKDPHSALETLAGQPDKAKETATSQERDLGRVDAHTFDMYKKIAEELTFATGKKFEIAGDIPVEDLAKLSEMDYTYTKINAIIKGEGNLDHFDQIKSAIEEASARSDIQQIIDLKILEIEESIAREKGIQLKDLLQEKLRNPDYLPTHQEVRLAFPTRGEFMRYVGTEKGQQLLFEVWTRESINSLSDYLRERIDLDKRVPAEQPVTILEVGAGDGRLTYLLQKRMADLRQQHKLNIIATDRGVWEKMGTTPGSNVQLVDYQEALAKYMPDIVICSWMVHGEDWTPAFRAQEEVKEYILIGDEEVTGTTQSWTTINLDSDHPDATRQKFKQIYLDETGNGRIRGQIGRADAPYFGNKDSDLMDFSRTNSRIASFRRLTPKNNIEKTEL